MVLEADEFVAARAASIVATMAGDPLMTLATVPLLAAAALHTDTGVRAVAALGAARAGSAATQVIKICLGDVDPARALPGVPRTVAAARALGRCARAERCGRRPQSQRARQGRRAGGTQSRPVARQRAPGRSDRVRAYAPDRISRGCARRRRRASRPPPACPALSTPAAPLRICCSRRATRWTPSLALLAAKDYAGAAAPAGTRAWRDLQRGERGGRALPESAPVEDRLGPARGRPASRSSSGCRVGAGPSMAGNALVYTISVPGRTLIPAPLTFGFDRAELTARLRIGAGDPAAIGVARASRPRSGRRRRPDREPARRRRGSVQADVVARRRHRRAG